MKVVKHKKRKHDTPNKSHKTHKSSSSYKHVEQKSLSKNSGHSSKNQKDTYHDCLNKYMNQSDVKTHIQKMKKYGNGDCDDIEPYFGNNNDNNKNDKVNDKPFKKMRTLSIDDNEPKDIKNNIKEDKDITSKSDSGNTIRDVTKWRQKHNITIQHHGSSDKDMNLDPFWEFQDAPFDKRIWQEKGFERPTVIQSQAWPILLTPSDMICIARTGSGKTLTFLLPLFQKLVYKQSKLSKTTPPHFSSRLSVPHMHLPKPVPTILILAPTRELAHQIHEQARLFSRFYNLKSCCLYGGSPKFAQISLLQQGVHVIIATPGRLNDLMEMKKACLKSVKFVVLDEADRMLDMGFEPQINKIFQNLSVSRQTLLFSATWPPSIESLAHKFLKNPVQINVGSPHKLIANKDISQSIISCKEDDKMSELVKILKELIHEEEVSGDIKKREKNSRNHIDLGGKVHEKCIVFTARKIRCHDLANALWDDGFSVDSLHGDRPQYERSKIMNAFKNNTLRMLVASDVAARGLDVKDVGVVINYDMPTGINASEDYVHRIGRTGRAGVRGRSYSLFTEKDKKVAGPLIKLLQQSDQTIPSFLHDYLPRFAGRPYKRGGQYDRFGKYRSHTSGRGYMSNAYTGRGRGRSI